MPAQILHKIFENHVQNQTKVHNTMVSVSTLQPQNVIQL